MADDSLLVISESHGLPPRIGSLAAMLRYGRHTTLSEVRGLSQAELDHLQDPESNSIAALLHHIASVEWVYQLITFEGRDPTAAERAEWGPALDLGEAGRTHLRGRPLDFYVDLLERVRAHTLEGLRHRDDAWLAVRHQRQSGPVDHHWMWFHVLEDELNHRGQIRWLKRRLPQQA